MDKKADIVFDCKACGDRSLADSSHRLCTFILKNPPDEKGFLAVDSGAGKAGKKSKEERRAAKAAKSRGDDPTENGDNDDDGDDGPAAAEPVSGAAAGVAKLSVSKSAPPRPDGDAELEARLAEDRAAISAKVEAVLEDAESLEQTVGALEALKEEVGLAAEDLLGFVFESVFDEDVLKDGQAKASAKLIQRLQKTCARAKSAQQVLLVCIEGLCGERCEAALLKRTPHVLKAFYDADLLDEEAIVRWAEKKSKTANRELSKKVKKAAEPFVTWLKEAEEDGDEGEEDDEGDDDDEE